MEEEIDRDDETAENADLEDINETDSKNEKPSVGGHNTRSSSEPVHRESHEELTKSVSHGTNVVPWLPDYLHETSTKQQEPAALAVDTSAPKTRSPPCENTATDDKKIRSLVGEANVVQVVSPAGRVARKIARLERGGTESTESSALPLIRQALSNDSKNTAQLTKSWSSKEEERQLKSEIRHQALRDASADTAQPPLKMTWAEKEEKRQLKSEIARRTEQIHDQGEVAPGSFSTVSRNDHPTRFVTVDEEERSSLDRISPALQHSQPSSSSSIIQATLVDPIFAEVNILDSNMERDLDRNTRQRLRRRRFQVIAAINGLGLVGVVLLLFFLVWNKDDDTATSVSLAPSFSPSSLISTGSPSTSWSTTEAPTAHNPFNLPMTTWETILEDPTSPQAQAYKWLLEDSLASSTYEYYARDSNDTTNLGNEWHYHQRYALAVLHFATGDKGVGWKQNSNWLNHDEFECRWFSTALQDDIIYPCYEEEENGETGRYKILHLRDNALHGTLPPETFSLLPKLQRIELSENDLSGTIASEIGELAPSLENLQLKYNKLTGTLPLELFSLTGLISMELSYNNLSGWLPTQIGALTNLDLLRFEDNSNLSGLLPTELGLLTSLTSVSFGTNRFNGTLPSEIGNWKQLKILHGHENGFTGTIPTEIGRLTRLLDLRFFINSLSGQIPSQIGGLSVVQYIVLPDNNLTSSIPSEFGRLSTLKRLLLEVNLLYSSIPSELGLMKSIERLYLHRNHLAGTIPNSLGAPNSLAELLLHDNFLTGAMPPGIFHYPLPNFKRLLLFSNYLVGTIPPELGFLSNMVDCWIESNSFRGSLPSTIGRLTSLRSMRINDNDGLTGSLPSEIRFLSKLEFFNFSNTSLIGTIPDELCRLDESKLIFNCSSYLCGCNCTCPITQQPDPSSSPEFSTPTSSPTPLLEFSNSTSNPTGLQSQHQTMPEAGHSFSINNNANETSIVPQRTTSPTSTAEPNGNSNATMEMPPAP